MTNFQPTCGVIMIIIAIVMIIIGSYLTFVTARALSKDESQDAKLSKGEKQGGIATSVIAIIIGIAIGVYGIILVLPKQTRQKAKRIFSAKRPSTGGQTVIIETDPTPDIQS